MGVYHKGPFDSGLLGSRTHEAFLGSSELSGFFCDNMTTTDLQYAVNQIAHIKRIQTSLPSRAEQLTEELKAYLAIFDMQLVPDKKYGFKIVGRADLKTNNKMRNGGADYPTSTDKVEANNTAHQAH